MSREQNLIGYQIIRRTNNSDVALLDTHKVLNWLDPLTGEDLLIDGVAATVDGVKAMVYSNMAIIDKDGGDVAKFIQHYPVSEDIDTGLQQFAVVKSNVDGDIQFTATTRASIMVALPSVTIKSQITKLADNFNTWLPKVAKVISPSELSQYEQAITTFQDILNAMAFELRGIDSYSGSATLDTVEKRVKLANNRITAAQRFWFRVPVSVETTGFKAILDYIALQIISASTLADCDSLGQYIDANVPQLPLVRRWWQYVV